jgi:hypothetical protein
MRILYSSDFHIDASETSREAAKGIAKYVETAGADAVVIAGDVGNTLDELGEVLSYFADVDIPRLFTAGNHDVWIEKTEAGSLFDSRAKYEIGIPELCHRMGFVDLTRDPIIIENVGFVGSLGWYDYSFADPRLGLSDDDYWRGRYKDEIWWDKGMTFWSPRGRAGHETAGKRLRDPEVCHGMVTTLESHLQAVEDHVDQIIAVVHTLPFQQTLPRSDPPYYLDAFTGSEKLGTTLSAHPKVTHHIGAHKHLNGDWTIGNIQSHRRALGRAEGETPLDDLIGRSLGLITI